MSAEPTLDRTRDEPQDDSESSLFDVTLPLAENWRLLVTAPIVIGVLALGIAFAIPPTYTARTSFLPPPQQQQGLAATALASLGALSSLAGVTSRTPGDQYVALLQSVTVEDRLIDKFQLMAVFKADYRADARRALEGNTKVWLGKKDGLITVEVDDKSPDRAAAIANQYVEELRHLTSQLALTEAQQRRVFFHERMKESRDQLARAQVALQASGFNAGALRAEPKAAAEAYARIKAEVTAAEVRLQTVRRLLTDSAPEVQQQQARLFALRDQLSRIEATDATPEGPGYVTKYREFKYQETLFELFSRQYELARLDESREGGLIQVVDAATPPERKSKPPRLLIGLLATAISAVALAAFVLARHRWRSAADEPKTAVKLNSLRAALRRR